MMMKMSLLYFDRGQMINKHEYRRYEISAEGRVKLPYKHIADSFLLKK